VPADLRRLMRTYFWICLFTSYRITANQLIESNVIPIANNEFKNIYIYIRLHSDFEGKLLVIHIFLFLCSLP
jgi:hypothetical protein